MCAGASGTIGTSEVGFYGGYYGGSFSIDDFDYEPHSEREDSLTIDEMADRLCHYKKRELVIMFLELIRDSDE